ncbi:Pre-mRNA splicing factor PRP21 like protein-domain-containing protein [Paraphysoderma sedebokerense]|nr:Pre-mRNA splicing factor PRP21 like protein-domain-containing protein [Paraphysoderma sedebokerense]
MTAVEMDVDARQDQLQTERNGDVPDGVTNGSHDNDDDSELLAGIIYPPPEVRGIVEKTASFVARNGIQFEERIRENEKSNPKFCFLNPTDPYHAFYQYRVKEAKEGKIISQEDIEPESEQEVKPEEQPEKVAPKQPPHFEYIVDMPNISAQDLDILKLTAQFVARNGRQFMNQLAQRESRNYQFDFLRPSHSLFGYFNRLVEQYTKVLLPSKDLKRNLMEVVMNKYTVYDRIKERVEYAVWEEEKRRKAAAEEDAEKTAFLNIDWHDFVVVETVEFTENDENLEFPPPTTLMELQNMTLIQKKEAMAAEIKQQEADNEEDMEMDMEEEDMEESPPLKPTSAPAPPTNIGPMKIRTDYVPKVAAKQPAPDTSAGQVFVFNNQVIPADQVEKHMRISLLDPNWREQRQVAEAKGQKTNLVTTGENVAATLKSIATYRTDIFGTDEEEEEKRKLELQRKAEEAKKKVIWDGHTASIQSTTKQIVQNMSIEDQIAQIHKSKGLTQDSRRDAIGPRVVPVDEDSMDELQPTPGASSSYGFPTSAANIPPGAAAPTVPSLPAPSSSSMQLPAIPPMPPGWQPGMPIPGVPIPGMPVPPMAGTARTASAMEEGGVNQEPSKKQKLADGFVPEDEWLSQHPGTVTFSISVPNLPDKHPSFNGAALTISLPLTAKVSELKDQVASISNLASGKQKLTIIDPNGNNIVLKNTETLASYNIKEGSEVSLGMKERGGRR